MRRATVVGLIGLAAVLLSARPASAQYDWIKYIQQLSGPGPFELQGVTVTFGCEIDADRQKQKPAVTKASPLLYQKVFCDSAQNWKAVRRFYAVTFATGDGENNLVFPTPVERVSASIYLGTGAFRLHEAIDVGTSAGFMRFSGMPDKGVTKYVIVPYAGVRPLALIPNSTNKVLDYIARGVELKGGLIIFPQGFRLSDFGAIDGPADLDWDGNVEASWFWGLRFTVVF